MAASSGDTPSDVLPAEADLVTWRSHVGVKVSADRRILRSTSKEGWGSAGAVSDAFLTRTSDVDGFLAVIPQPNTPLFIGASVESFILLEEKLRQMVAGNA